MKTTLQSPATVKVGAWSLIFVSLVTAARSLGAASATGGEGAASTTATATARSLQPVGTVVCEESGDSRDGGMSFGLIAESPRAGAVGQGDRRRVILNATFAIDPFADQLILEGTQKDDGSYALAGGGLLHVRGEASRWRLRIDWRGRSNLASYWGKASDREFTCDDAAAAEDGARAALMLFQLDHERLVVGSQRAQRFVEAEAGGSAELVRVAGETVAAATSCEGFVSLTWTFSVAGRLIRVEDAAEVAGADCVYGMRPGKLEAAAETPGRRSLAAVGGMAKLEVAGEAALSAAQSADPRFVSDGHFMIVAAAEAAAPQLIFRGQTCGRPTEMRIDGASGKVLAGSPPAQRGACP